MDLLGIARTIMRHKIAVIPVILLVILGLYYILKVKPPTFQSNAILQVVTPPSAPSPAQIAADPKLGKINANNPYLTYGNPDFVADAALEMATSVSAKQAFLAQGVSSKYQVAISSDFGNPPFINITGVGTTAVAAEYSARTVSATVIADLHLLQARLGVNPTYMYTANELTAPGPGQNVVTAKLRTLIAVIGVGVILMFITVSVAEAFSRRREEELDAVPATAQSKPRPRAKTVAAGDDAGGHEAAEHTQEFASPFLTSGSRRGIRGGPEGRAALKASAAREGRRADDDGDDDDY